MHTVHDVEVHTNWGQPARMTKETSCTHSLPASGAAFPLEAGVLTPIVDEDGNAPDQQNEQANQDNAQNNRARHKSDSQRALTVCKNTPDVPEASMCIIT